MSNASQTENDCNIMTSTPNLLPPVNMIKMDEKKIDSAQMHASKLSPPSTKARSVPSTPSQRPQSPPDQRMSPNLSRQRRDGSPQSMRTAASRTPPAQRRGGVCKYETGMTQARRRVPYTLGPEKLEADPEKSSKILNAKEEFRLTSEMQSLYAQLLPTDETEQRRNALVEKLERLLCGRWPGQNIRVSVFGSTGNRLGTKDSDVDICITTNYKDIEHVCSIADLLARNGMERVVCVSSAKVPIVKVWDPELQVACDMNVNNPIALENTELIRSYVAIDKRFRPLAMIVKHWAKRRILNDAALGGTLSSYTWICLVLNFLQTRKPPILPSLQNTRDLEPRHMNGVNVAFDKDVKKYDGFGKDNTATLGQLLFEFFHYYGHELDFEQSVMSVRLGRVIPKAEKNWHLLQDNRLCVEEPFNLNRNLGNTADDTSMRGIHLELRRACDLLVTGELSKCCEQYVPIQCELPRRTDATTFIHPVATKAIIPQLPPQPQAQPPRIGRGPFKNRKRGDLHHYSGRRASNPPGRPSSHLRDTHLRDLPFAMTPQELQLQAQHQQHLLHDQLFQQYQYLQMQEQELRMQLYRQRGLMAASGYSSSAFSGTDSTDDGKESVMSSRASATSRVPMSAPLYQSRFGHSSTAGNGPSSGIVTNPASPLMAAVLPDSRRYPRRASLNQAAASTLRAQSQPARVVSSIAGFPHLSHRFEVPVRQAGDMGSRRTSIHSASQDPLSGYHSGRLSSQGTRYDMSRRPVEYVGYYVGQSPSLSASAYAGSATISPVLSNAGLAIHNGGLSPRQSTRSSRIPSVSASPSSHYATLINGTTIMTPVTENGPSLEAEIEDQTPPSVTSGPLVVDGSVSSPPRRQVITRPVRSSSEELDVSVTTSEDVAIDTPPSPIDVVSEGIGQDGLHVRDAKHFGGELINGHGFASLNGSSFQGVAHRNPGESEASAARRKMEQERLLVQLTNGLATVNGGDHHILHTKPRAVSSIDAQQLPYPLASMTNGNYAGSAAMHMNGSNEWQVQSKKKRKGKKSGKLEHQEGSHLSSRGEVLPQDESLRKGG